MPGYKLKSIGPFYFFVSVARCVLDDYEDQTSAQIIMFILSNEGEKTGMAHKKLPLLVLGRYKVTESFH